MDSGRELDSKRTTSRLAASYLKQVRDSLIQTGTRSRACQSFTMPSRKRLKPPTPLPNLSD